MHQNCDLWKYLENSNKPIWFYGTGNGADKIFLELDKRNIKVSGVFASNGFVRHRVFHGFNVMSFDEAKNINKEMIVLVAFGTERAEVIENIKRISAHQELYVPDVPVYGDNVFTEEYYNVNKPKLDEIREVLADDISKKVFDDIIKAKLTGNIENLFSCESGVEEYYKNILTLNHNETYMDLGAYTGDTIFEFIDHVRNYKKIIAVEPDKKSFQKLLYNTKDICDCKLVNCAAYSSDTQLSFSKGSGRGSFAGSGKEHVLCRSVDSVLSGSDATYIKMDVEGFEREAIIGAENTIKKYRPKMRIAAYHRGEDLFSIPAQVLSICKDYKVYIRHYGGVPAWNTDFFFV